jgi:hypothetical protein
MPTFAYDENLLKCTVSGKTSAPDIGSIKQIPTSEVSVSIRIANNKIVAIVSGEKSPFPAPVYIFGFNYFNSASTYIGKDLSNNSRYILNTEIKDYDDKSTIDFYSIELSRISGDITIMHKYDSKIGSFVKLVQGKCIKIEGKNKF